ncbi:MAG TPA: hypothetical protein VGS07_17935 [Thermoanaerobaculia bacterium]|nr:hypothetical protein [Thermoanaerobaculia bacterium]
MRDLWRAAVVVLALALGAPCAYAREAPSKAAVQARHAEIGSSLISNLWSFLGRIWTAQPSPAASFAVCAAGDAGCGIDPWGGRQTQTVDEGCGIDPWGRCVTGH